MSVLVRFATVGVATTLLDLLLFNVSVLLGAGTIVAHVLSSIVVLPLSFLGQRRAFRSRGDVRRQVVCFSWVTLVGVFVLQPLILDAASHALPKPGLAGANVAKACAMVAGITWNLLWFRWHVFPS